MCVEDGWLCLSAFHLYANLHMVQALFFVWFTSFTSWDGTQGLWDYFVLFGGKKVDEQNTSKWKKLSKNSCASIRSVIYSTQCCRCAHVFKASQKRFFFCICIAYSWSCYCFRCCLVTDFFNKTKSVLLQTRNTAANFLQLSYIIMLWLWIYLCSSNTRLHKLVGYFMIKAPWLCKIKGQCPPRIWNISKIKWINNSLTHFLTISIKLTFWVILKTKAKVGCHMTLWDEVISKVFMN